MSKPYIELIGCDSGDWSVLRVNLGEDFKREGHSISDYDWMALLNLLGFEVDYKIISDEDMEYGRY